MNNMVDNAISYIDSLPIDELEDVFNSHGIETIRKPELNQPDTNIIEQFKKQCYLSVIDRDGDNEYDLDKFANLIIHECIHIIEDFEIIDRNGTAIEQVVDALCRIRCEIKEKFEVN
jgi:hypothetical protein